MLAGAVGAAIGAAWLLWSKLTHVAPASGWIAVAVSAPLLGAAIGALRRLPLLWTAQLIDRTHNLADRFASALSFAEHPEASISPFESACIRDALRHVNQVEPKRAAPFRPPRHLLTWLVALSTLVGATLVQVPTRAATTKPPTLRPALLNPDDLNAFRQEAADLRERALSPELATSVDELNRLLEQLANREINREQALRNLRALEDALQRASQAHPQALKDALGALGKSLERAAVTKTLAKALSANDPAAAAQEAQRMAKQVREGGISKRELDAMRAALQKAAKARRGQSAEQLAARREELQRLLHREREKRSQSESERRLLKRRERELERLRREEETASEQERQLERLQREMDDAAESLNNDDSQQASESLDRGAEELNRMAREQMTEQQRQQMRQQLEQLREMLRRQREQGGQGQQGQGQGQQRGGQRLRLDQFTKLAQGQGQQGQGQQGQGQQGQQQGQQGQDGQGNQGQGREPGDGAKVLTLGQNGSGTPVTLEIPGMGRTKTVGREPGNGREAGSNGPPPNTEGTATSLDSDHVNTRVEGEQQAGPSRSQVIESASSDGFAARGYEKVFTEYERHAESVIERDEIPGGYRFYVRRYFQLIRPRDQSP